jgi:hypothetical protein
MIRTLLDGILPALVQRLWRPQWRTLNMQTSAGHASYAGSPGRPHRHAAVSVAADEKPTVRGPATYTCWFGEDDGAGAAYIFIY